MLALPPSGDGPFGLVVFVHGDGPMDATNDGFYRPLWESFAQAGYASLSWSKPGIGASGGKWLSQSMDDRAREVTDIVAWARQQPEIDRARVGLWGASQAGWVLPKVAEDDPGVRFVIAISPAINWQQQGRYNLLAELKRDDATQAEVDQALQRRETTLGLLRAGASYANYRAAVDADHAMTAERWEFVSKNYTSDATADLQAMRGTPVLLILGGHDINVDVADTEATYRRVFTRLTVEHHPDATHSMVRHNIEQSSVWLTATAIVAPRLLFADGFLAGQQAFLERI